MKASISFPELQSVLKERIGQDISFAFVDNKTIRVTYPLNLGFIKKDISANVIIKEMTGSDLLVQLSAGMGTDTLLSTMLNLIRNKVPAGLIEKRPDAHIIVHLNELEQAKTVLDTITVNDIHVLNNGLEVEGLLKQANQ